MRAADIAADIAGKSYAAWESFWDRVFDLGDRLSDGFSKLWERFNR